MLISVCIPAYNASKFIRETLDSVQKQTFKDWEMIVVEDGSSDGTREIVEQFATEVAQKVTFLRNEINLGLPATRNVAADASSAEWIAFLDSDDVWEPGHLEDMVQISLDQPDCDLIHSGTKVFDSDLGTIIFEQSLSDKVISSFPISLFDGSYGIQPSSAMISRDSYQAAGGSNPAYSYAEDKELWFRCAKAGFKFGFTGKNTLLYRKHPEAMSNRGREVATATAQVYDIFSDWEAIPKKLRYQHISEAWLSATRMMRKTDKGLAREFLSKSMEYRFTLRQLMYWLVLRVA